MDTKEATATVTSEQSGYTPSWRAVVAMALNREKLDPNLEHWFDAMRELYRLADHVDAEQGRYLASPYKMEPAFTAAIAEIEAAELAAMASAP